VGNSSREIIDQITDSPAIRFVNKVLLDSVKMNVERIHFRRRPDADNFEGTFSVFFEKDGTETLIHELPMDLWRYPISRLKVMARMVDCGSNVSKDGYINFRLSKNRTAHFYLPDNPNPHTSNAVTVEYQGTSSTDTPAGA